jgi:hypothetical protein
MLILLKMGSGLSLSTDVSLNFNHSGKKQDVGNRPAGVTAEGREIKALKTQ